jgi:hypothetical protein
MKVMSDATDMISEPFPRISWSSDELVSMQENKYVSSTNGRRIQFFRMSPKANNTHKRKRTVSCDGCLVRSPEFFDSTLLVKDSNDDSRYGADCQAHGGTTTTTKCRLQQWISKGESFASKDDDSCCASETFENQDSVAVISW